MLITESTSPVTDLSKKVSVSRKSRQSQGRKPRTDYIYGTTTGETSKILIHVDPTTGKISFGQGMREVYLERSYERPKGPKVVSRIPQAAPDLSFDEVGALDDNFDHLFAFDTNTRVIDGKTISVVGVVIIADVAPRPGDRGRTWQFGVPFCLEYGGLKTKLVRQHGLDTADAPEEFFKLCLDMGLSLNVALSIMRSVKQAH